MLLVLFNNLKSIEDEAQNTNHRKKFPVFGTVYSYTLKSETINHVELNSARKVRKHS